MKTWPLPRAFCGEESHHRAVSSSLDRHILSFQEILDALLMYVAKCTGHVDVFEAAVDACQDIPGEALIADQPAAECPET